MSDLNCKWLTENFENISVNFFDIGCADLRDTIQFKNALPLAKIYAFECADVWQETNRQIIANLNNIHYYNLAITDHNNVVTFYPSSSLRNIDWPWSGSTCRPGPDLQTDDWVWGTPYDVQAATLKDFCSENNVYPDIIHIDVQGAEYKVFSEIGHYRPIVVWAEISEFRQYETGVVYDDFAELMDSLGYKEVYKEMHDSLYVLKDQYVTEYYPK